MPARRPAGLAGLLSPGGGLRVVARGGDVYLFLIGKLLLSEGVRPEGRTIGFWRFLRLAAVVMAPALLAAPWPRLLLG